MKSVYSTRVEDSDMAIALQYFRSRGVKVVSRSQLIALCVRLTARLAAPHIELPTDPEVVLQSLIERGELQLPESKAKTTSRTASILDLLAEEE